MYQFLKDASVLLPDFSYDTLLMTGVEFESSASEL